MSTERPILFSGGMVQAILAGRKSQTRRVVTRGTSYLDGSAPDKERWSELDFNDAHVDPGPSPAGNPGPYLKVARTTKTDVFRHRIYPRFWPGMKLWVRETWAPADLWVDGHEKDDPESIRYRADGEALRFSASGKSHALDTYAWTQPDKWRPSIFLPRWASRLTLEITSVRVERLQEITEEDSKAEEVDPYVMGHGPVTREDLRSEPGYHGPRIYRDGFEHVWDSLNKARGYSWESNPWVWVLGFRRLEAGERAA